MKTLSSFFARLFLWGFLFFPFILFAESQPVMPDQCNSLTGVWQGVAKDPNKLFGDGGPWPIAVFLVNNPNLSGNMVMKGFINAGQTVINDGQLGPDLSNALGGLLRGVCQHNQISGLKFWRQSSTRNCVDASNKIGEIKADHTLILYVPYSNAMTNTTFTLILKKTADAGEQDQLTAFREQFRVQNMPGVADADNEEEPCN